MHSLQIEPSSEYVEFESKYQKPSITTVKLHNDISNSHSSTLLFKIKTTNPRQFIVKPSIGYIKYGETKNINIVLQPTHEQISYSNEKFQILSSMVDQVLMDENLHFKKLDPKSFVSNILKVKIINKGEERVKPEGWFDNGNNQGFNKNSTESGNNQEKFNMQKTLFQSVNYNDNTNVGNNLSFGNMQAQNQSLYQSNYINEDNNNSASNQKQSSGQQITEVKESTIDTSTTVQFFQDKIQEKEKLLMQISEDKNRLVKELGQLLDTPANKKKSGFNVMFLLLCVLIGNLTATFMK